MIINFIENTFDTDDISLITETSNRKDSYYYFTFTIYFKTQGLYLSIYLYKSGFLKNFKLKDDESIDEMMELTIKKAKNDLIKLIHKGKQLVYLKSFENNIPIIQFEQVRKQGLPDEPEIKTEPKSIAEIAAN